VEGAGGSYAAGNTRIVAYPHLSRFAVMKHLDVLRNTELIQTRKSRRQRMHSLNVGPIRQVYQSWFQPFMSFDQANLK
jgi:hypothetical protein